MAVEYALASVAMAAVASLLWLFFQGFVQGNLYGGGERGQNQFFGLAENDKALGLERTVALPFP